MPKVTKERALTPRQRLFVEAFLGEARFNATEAARIAKYSGNDKTLASVGSENLRKPEIQSAVAARISEAAMTANETLARLSQHARASVCDVLNADNKFDLDVARANKTDHLIKKFKVKRTSRIVKELNERGEYDTELETTILDEQIEFEMVDAQSALVHLGRFHKLFTDKQELTGKDDSPLMQPIADALLKVYGDNDGVDDDGGGDDKRNND